MLPLLLKVPESRSDFDVFSFNLRDEFRRCNEAILVQKNIDLSEFQIDPINFDHLTDWLTNVSQAMGQINSVLSLQSSDLFNVDLSNENAKSGWVYTLYTELRDAEAALQI